MPISKISKTVIIDQFKLLGKASLTRSLRRDQPDLSSSGVHMPPQRAMQGDVSTMWIITEDNRYLRDGWGRIVGSEYCTMYCT